MRAIAVALLALVLAAPAWASEQRPTLAELEGELMCPTCKTTLDQSDSAVAERMRVYIRTRIAQGATKSEIKGELADMFGEAVLASPPKKGFNLLAWVLPVVGLVGGAAAVGALAVAWSRRRAGDDDGDDVPLDPELDRRVDAALHALD